MIGIEEVLEAMIARSETACADRGDHLELEPLVLRHRLDHEVGVGYARNVSRQRDAVTDRGGVILVELAASDAALQRALDALVRPLDAGVINISQDHLQTRRRDRLGDPGAHQPAADDGNRADLAGGGGHTPVSVPGRAIREDRPPRRS